MVKTKAKDNVSDDTKRPDNVVNAYRERLKLLKQAQEFSAKGEIPKAVEKYSHYLGILASYYRVTEPQLSPKVFDVQKDITEMLLISHAYWDLAKSYDRSPKLQKECIRCLGQFIQFTLGHKFQHLNAQMLKKFLKSNKVYNRKPFEQALHRINVESKACYIATLAYPNDENHILTDFRAIKQKIVLHKLGFKFVDTYYFLSSNLVSFLENKPRLSYICTHFIFRPVLKVIHNVVTRLV